MVSTLSLDGPCKWKLKQNFRKGIVVEMDKIQVQSQGFNTEPGWAMNKKFGVKMRFLSYRVPEGC
jgi:hypothetical protein